MARQSNSVETYMPLVIEKYHGDTTHLTTIQHGAYLLLLMAYWRRGGALPADDVRLGAIAKMTPQEWRKHRPTIAEFFEERDGMWFQKRAENELARARAKSEAAAESARRRWERNAPADANASAAAHPKAMQADMREGCGGDAPPSSTIVDAYASTQRPANPKPGSRGGGKIALPSDWSPSASHRAKAAELGLDCDDQADRMRNWAASEAKKTANWDARFHNWLSGAKDRNYGGKSGPDRQREAHQTFLAAAFASADRGGG